MSEGVLANRATEQRESASRIPESRERRRKLTAERGDVHTRGLENGDRFRKQARAFLETVAHHKACPQGGSPVGRLGVIPAILRFEP